MDKVRRVMERITRKCLHVSDKKAVYDALSVWMGMRMGMDANGMGGNQRSKQTTFFRPVWPVKFFEQVQ
jgi:hypothetical protein